MSCGGNRGAFFGSRLPAISGMLAALFLFYHRRHAEGAGICAPAQDGCSCETTEARPARRAPTAAPMSIRRFRTVETATSLCASSDPWDRVKRGRLTSLRVPNADTALTVLRFLRSCAVSRLYPNSRTDSRADRRTPAALLQNRKCPTSQCRESWRDGQCCETGAWCASTDQACWRVAFIALLDLLSTAAANRAHAHPLQSSNEPS